VILIPIIIVLSFFYIIPWLFGAPFEPTHEKKLKKILKLANVKKGEKIAELGSGDGRIVIAFAQKGAEAHGFEINPFLVFLSRRKIKKLGLTGKAFIHWKNFWKADLSKYDKIILFQFSIIMGQLENKLKKELKPNAKVISYYWKFPKWKYANRIENIFLYLPKDLKPNIPLQSETKGLKRENSVPKIN
jgi:hypothetical protein